MIPSDFTFRYKCPAQSDMETRDITIGALLREVAAARHDAEALLEISLDGSD